MYTKAFYPDTINNYSFLVTGGAGFIGSNITEYLIRHNAGKVRIMDNLSTGFKTNIEPFLNSPGVSFFEGDISNADDCMKACEGIDFVIHQAALGSVPRSIDLPIGTHNANVNGFVNMLEAVRHHNVKRMVYASSSSVYGDHPALPKLEEVIGNPLSPYAVSKRVNELYAAVYVLTYGIELIGLRYFNIFGPRQNPKGPYAAVIPLFCQALQKGESAFINGDGEQTRDFTFVENAVQANIRALFTDKKEALGKVFNIALGETISINDLYKELQTLSASSVGATHREERKGDVRNSLADISAAKEMLGFEPGIRVKEGLRITKEWFFEHN